MRLFTLWLVCTALGSNAWSAGDEMARKTISMYSFALQEFEAPTVRNKSANSTLAFRDVRNGAQTYSYVPKNPGGANQAQTSYPNTWLFLSPNGGLCVATAVGPRSLITAGHCVDRNAVYELKQPGGAVKAECASLYKPDSEPTTCGKTEASTDLAVCTLSDKPKQPNLYRHKGAGYETLDIAHIAPVSGEVKLIAFTGCDSGTQVDKVHVHTLAARKWPAATESAVPAEAASTTESAEPLCKRDSGAPWMRQKTPGLVALHVCKATDYETWGVALDNPAVAAFLRQHNTPKTPLCGLSTAAKPCR